MREGVTYKRLGEVAPSQKYDGEITSVSGLYWLLNLDMVEPNTGNVIKKVMATKEELDGSITSFSPNNVLYSKLRPYLNKVVLPDECGYCTTELVPLFPKKDLLSREYLAYFLRSNTFVEFINDKVAGAKMPRVKMSDFWNHPIPVPSLSTQELIVRELDSISSVISAKKQQVLELENLAQAIFLDMFGDPITNPKGWEVKKLSEACDEIFAGGDVPKGDSVHEKDAEHTIPIYSNGVKDEGLYGYTSKARVLSPAVTISGRGTIGAAFIRREPFFPIIRLIVAIPNKSLDLTFFGSSIKMLSLESTGNSIQQLTIPMIKEYTIPIPPLSLQQAFAEKVQAIEEQKRLINQSIAEFESLLAQRMEFHFA